MYDNFKLYWMGVEGNGQYITCHRLTFDVKFIVPQSTGARDKPIAPATRSSMQYIMQELFAVVSAQCTAEVDDPLPAVRSRYSRRLALLTELLK